MSCVFPLPPTHSHMHTQALTQSTDSVIPPQPKCVSVRISTLRVDVTVKVDEMSHTHFNKVKVQSDRIPCQRSVPLLSQRESAVLKCHCGVNDLHKAAGVLIKMWSLWLELLSCHRKTWQTSWWKLTLGNYDGASGQSGWFVQRPALWDTILSGRTWELWAWWTHNLTPLCYFWKGNQR